MKQDLEKFVGNGCVADAKEDAMGVQDQVYGYQGSGHVADTETEVAAAVAVTVRASADTDVGPVRYIAVCVLVAAAPPNRSKAEDSRVVRGKTAAREHATADHCSYTSMVLNLYHCSYATAGKVVMRTRYLGIRRRSLVAQERAWPTWHRSACLRSHVLPY